MTAGQTRDLSPGKIALAHARALLAGRHCPNADCPHCADTGKKPYTSNRQQTKEYK